MTKANRKNVVKRVIKDTLLAKGSDGVCTAVVGIPSDSPALARYRSTVHARTAPGDLLVRLWWRDNVGKNHQTLAVMNKRAKLKFESLMMSYSRPAPEKVPMSPEPRTSVASTRPALTNKFSWSPWSGPGNVCVAINGYGKCVVRKDNVLVTISVDFRGNITHHDESASVESVWGYQTTKQVEAQLVNRGGVQCWEVTVSISWTDPVGTMTGTNKQVYTLCADGSGYYSSE